MFSAVRLALLAIGLASAFACRAQGAGNDCAAAAGRCASACAAKLLGGLNALRQCKSGCDAELQACTSRSQPGPASPMAGSAQPGAGDAKVAAASLSGEKLGTRTLSIASLPTGAGLRRYDVAHLDGVPLLDLTHSQSDDSRIPVLRSFARAYADAKLDWTNGTQVRYDVATGGDGRGLIRHWLRTSQTVAQAKSLEADLSAGIQGTAWMALEPEAVRRFIPCAGLPVQPNTPCWHDANRRGLAQFQGGNEFERERTRAAYLKEATASLQKAFAPRALAFYVLEQREVRDYDFQREAFALKPRMSQASAFAAAQTTDPQPYTDVLGVSVKLNRLLSDELRIPKAEAESWLNRLSEHQAPGLKGRRAFSLVRLECQTAAATAQVAASCTLASAELFADPGLRHKLADL